MKEIAEWMWGAFFIGLFAAFLIVLWLDHRARMSGYREKAWQIVNRTGLMARLLGHGSAVVEEREDE